MSPTRSPEGGVSSTERRPEGGAGPERRPEGGGASGERRPATPRTKRVLIFHVRAGAGHERAARAVERAIQQLDPHAEPIVKDALEYSSPLFRAFYASTYNRMVARAPRVWGIVYKGAEKTPIEGFRQEVRTRLTLWNCRGYLEAVEKYKPDAVLCTQFLPAEVFAFLRERGMLRVPVSTAITDYSIHPIWVYRGMDRYYVASDVTKEQLVDTGVVSEDRIEVTGVPIDPRFAVAMPQAEARKALGLDPDPSRLTVLLVGGGFGWGPLEGMMDVILALPEKVQVLAITGRNEQLRHELNLRARGKEARVKVHGFTDQIDLFMAASDVLVGKSGGLTTSESMARGLPMVVYRPIPGQEERNCDFLLEAGAAVRAHDLDELHYRLQHFVADPEHLARMRGKAAGIGRPRSAFDVARSVLGRVVEIR
jgi:processive 1,2-diacylglycerol beta-glucosyltransferase